MMGYNVHRCTDSCAEIEYNERRWEVNLVEKMCTCREWKIKSVPCVHGAAFIVSLRNVKWKDYVHPYFTIVKFKSAHAEEIATMPSNHEWMECDLGYKILPLY
jgi:SWIM zinc finger